MGTQKPYQPIYKQFIQYLEKSFLLLDDTSLTEIREFIKSQQNTNGAFTDRAGNPDLYYSLFGVWLSKAINLTPQLKELETFIISVHHDKKNVIDEFAVLLIKLALAEKEFSKPTVFALLKMAFNRGKQINTTYLFFLFLLSFDALYGKNRLIYFLFRNVLRFYKMQKDAPCSINSALLMAKFLTGKKVENEVQQLFAYFDEGKGFKVFKALENADLLSTAVALFALKTTGADIRIVAPDCLNLIQQNYNSGAFLSGDGDMNRDLEYTFYGLLALGILA